MSYGFVITWKGLELLTRLSAGGMALELTRVQVGRGRIPEGADPREVSGLVEPVADAYASVPIVEDKSLSFVVEYRNDLDGGLGEGFWLSEFCVFARGGGGAEICLYYASLGDFPQYVESYQKGNLDIRRFPVSIALSGELEVNVTYPTSAFVTSEELSELLAEAMKKIFSIHVSAEMPKNWRSGDFWYKIVGEDDRSIILETSPFVLGTDYVVETEGLSETVENAGDMDSGKEIIIIT